MARIDHVRSRAENRGKTYENVKQSVNIYGKCEKRGKTRGIHVSNNVSAVKPTENANIAVKEQHFLFF